MQEKLLENIKSECYEEWMTNHAVLLSGVAFEKEMRIFYVACEVFEFFIPVGIMDTKKMDEIFREVCLHLDIDKDLEKVRRHTRELLVIFSSKIYYEKTWL